jgi:hypothetical protein
MIADGGTINFLGKCNKINLTMGEYVMNSPMISIPMGGADVVLGIQWLQSLGTVAFNFQELFMKFSLEGKEIELRGITGKPGKVISSNGMTKLLKNGHQGIISKLCSLDVQTSKPSIPQDLQRIIDKNSKVFEDIPKGLPPTGNHDHEIRLIPGSVPPNIRPYRYPYAQKSEIECMVEEMLEAGIIRPSQSSYSAPVVMVFKKDNSWRMCPDYRELNRITIKDKFPIPMIDELLDELHGAIYFTKLDLRLGYHQIRMKEEDIPKTTFRTHEGHYEFLVMPFGLTNAPSTFQGLMNSIFKPFLRKFVLVFFDDILIYSKSWEDHLQHVDKVLQLLKEKQLYAKQSKCFFRVKEVEYLGHIVSHEGVKVYPNNIKAMMDWLIPKALKNLRGFLGLTGYYRKFVRNYGRIEAPLTALTKKDEFSWTPEATKYFEQLKEVMCKTPVLTTPDFTKTFIVECDALGNGIGAVLMQEGRPLAFESRPLKGRDLHKPIYEKEMMEILHALNNLIIFLTDGKLPMRLDENEGEFTILEFCKIQFEGFCRFINQGFMEELHNFPKIEDTDKEIESRLFGNEYELAEPFIKERDVVYQSLTYYSELYVPARSIRRNSSKIQKQTVFLENIPLMNSHGTFVVNGIYRIMVNQILISLGIYYRSELDHNRINYIYTGTLISDWGRRSKLEIDVGERIWACVSRK